MKHMLVWKVETENEKSIASIPAIMSAKPEHKSRLSIQDKAQILLDLAQVKQGNTVKVKGKTCSNQKELAAAYGVTPAAISKYKTKPDEAKQQIRAEASRIGSLNMSACQKKIQVHANTSFLISLSFPCVLSRTVL